MVVMHSLRDYDADKSAGRMAVQAAAGALMSVTGHTCDDIVMCSSSREWDELLEVRPAAQDLSSVIIIAFWLSAAKSIVAHVAQSVVANMTVLQSK